MDRKRCQGYSEGWRGGVCVWGGEGGGGGHLARFNWLFPTAPKKDLMETERDECKNRERRFFFFLSEPNVHFPGLAALAWCESAPPSAGHGVEPPTIWRERHMPPSFQAHVVVDEKEEWGRGGLGGVMGVQMSRFKHCCPV